MPVERGLVPPATMSRISPSARSFARTSVTDNPFAKALSTLSAAGSRPGRATLTSYVPTKPEKRTVPRPRRYKGCPLRLGNALG